MRIFIASSGDLSEERKNLKILCYDNDYTPILWEDLDQSITIEKFQERINEEELKESDIVIFMIKSRLGKYTQEEFEESYNELGRRINRIYVYFFEIDNNQIDKRELRKILNLQAFLEDEGKLYHEVKDFQELENHFLKQKQFFNTKKTEIKQSLEKNIVLKEKNINLLNKIAIMYTSPVNQDYSGFISFSKIIDYFTKYSLNIEVHILNLENLYNIDEYDSIFIFTKTSKQSLIIEDDNFLSIDLKYEELDEISKNNENIKFHLFSLNSVENTINYHNFNFISFSENFTKKFNAFIHKEYHQKIKKGTPKINYENSDIPNDFNISKDLKTFVGRKHDIRNVIRDIINIKNTNKVYTLLASGGMGKTTLIKKVANEFALRGYFEDGFYFIDCEHLKDYIDFEEKVKIVFQMNNAIEFKEQLSLVKSIDRMIILDNFETLLHLDRIENVNKIKDLLFYITYYSTIIITSREKIDEDYEEVYPLNYLTLNESFELYTSIHTITLDEKGKKFLRDEILENILNRNPLAIKLVAKLKLNVYDLYEELSKDLFMTTDKTEKEVIESVFSKESDSNIEKSKSLFYSISLSFEYLEDKYKLMIELLSLFPDGIHKKNFILFYNQKEQKLNPHKIDYKDVNSLEDKSLITVSGEFIKLQSIIGRFAEYKFSKSSIDEKKEYFEKAFEYNYFMLCNIIAKYRNTDINSKINVNLFNRNKNNFIKCLDYISHCKYNEGMVSFISDLVNYLSFNTLYDKKIIVKFENIISTTKNELFKKFLKVSILNLNYFYGNFDETFNLITKEYPYNKIFLLDNNNKIESLIFIEIMHIYYMEGNVYALVKDILNKYVSFDNHISITHLYYLGCFKLVNKLNQHKLFTYRKSFTYYEIMLNSGRLNTEELIEYRNSLHKSEILEYVQTTYILFKSNENLLSINEIEKLVKTNDFTSGLKFLMLATIDKENFNKLLFENAIEKLFHIKYYYVDAILLYTKQLKLKNDNDYIIWLAKGKELAIKFQYKFLIYSFYCIENNSNIQYDESDYPFQDEINFERFYQKYNISN
ncbi:MAG: DUF4062 domain-containing protein [Arcobacteraceae bacterium]|nr:DUF4062 domain-containing protein [Arcobacteraceae bacterium]